MKKSKMRLILHLIFMMILLSNSSCGFRRYEIITEIKAVKITCLNCRHLKKNYPLSGIDCKTDKGDYLAEDGKVLKRRQFQNMLKSKKI